VLLFVVSFVVVVSAAVVAASAAASSFTAHFDDLLIAIAAIDLMYQTLGDTPVM